MIKFSLSLSNFNYQNCKYLDLNNVTIKEIKVIKMVTQKISKNDESKLIFFLFVGKYSMNMEGTVINHKSFNNFDKLLFLHELK